MTEPYPQNGPASEWRRVKDAFERALSMDPEERADFMATGFEGEPGLVEQLRRLLEADAAASRFLEDTPVPEFEVAVERDPWVGRRLGAYEVCETVGRGGSGLVLRARRTGRLREGEVAVKVVPAALVDATAERRFAAEMRTLAVLDHPNVAHLLDAGVTDEGLAWLAMDFVDGPPLDRYADDRGLGVRERLDLFRGVLEGVDHSHGRGVIHRDLKPGNVLVDSDGVPRIVDFGIAKLLAEGGVDARTVVLTRTAWRMLTPEYSSPEQLRGEVVDARTDVYSLGVMLYRLLTGRAPYALDTTHPKALVRVVSEIEPTRPSVAAQSPHGPSMDPEALRRALRGDLDAVILRALAKRPDDRYATAGAFLDDIDRVLAGEPVRARVRGPVGRAGVWLRRRWRGAVATALFVGAAVYGVDRLREAGAQRGAATAAAVEMTGLVSRVVAALAEDEGVGATGQRLAAVEAAVAALDSLEAALPSRPSPTFLATLAEAHQEVGSVQGHPTYANVGRPDEARRSYRRALSLWDELAQIAPNDVRARLELVETRILLSDLEFAAGDPVAGGMLLDSAEIALDGLGPSSDPARLSTDAMLAERQGTRWMILGDFARGAEYAERLPGLTRRIVAAADTDRDRRTSLEELPLALSQLALVRSRAGDAEGALQSARDAVRVADSIAALPGATARMVGIQASVWAQLGWRHNEWGQPEAADSAFTRAVEVSRGLVASDPTNVAAVSQLGFALFGRGRARILGRRWQGALDDHRESITLRRSVLGDGPAADLQVAAGWRQVAESLTGLGRFEEARDAYRTTLDLYDHAGAAAETAQERKQRAFAEMSFALHQHARATRGGEAEACAGAVEAEHTARLRWNALREEGLVSEGEEVIWAEFLAGGLGERCGGA